MSAASLEPNPQVAQRLDEQLARYPHCAERIYRRLLALLHKRQIVSIDAVYAEAQPPGMEARDTADDPNRPAGTRLAPEALPRVAEITRRYVCAFLTVEEIDLAVSLVIQREEAQNLENIANQPNGDFATLARKIHAYWSLGSPEAQLPLAEVMGTRVALIRTLISDELEFIGIAKHHLGIRDFDALLERTVGSDHRMGRIGGKAGGMLLAQRILAAADLPTGQQWPLRVPESVYIRSDVIEEFLELNRLGEYRNQKYKDIDEIRNEYPLIKGVFRNSAFPIGIVQKLRNLLTQIGNAPLIVRSSSLLEDRFGAAFCGKYASIFVANQGPLEARLQVLLGAIAEVYASALSPDPIQYRRAHNLIDYDEDMGVMIQKVVGRAHGRYFLPAFAGVAFGRNEYRWSPRIRREDGLARLVLGLGTRAVDRVGADYPRMAALGAPTLRPESSVHVIRQQAQKTIDVIDLQRNRLDSINLGTLLASSSERFPLLDLLVSVYQDGGLYPPTTSFIDAPPDQLCITFDKLLAGTNFAQHLQSVLGVLEQQYSSPVDVEFVCDGHDFYVLQCRPQSGAETEAAAALPTDVPPERIVFSASKFVRTGVFDDIEFIVYVDPRAYASVAGMEQSMAIARVVGRLNRKLAARRFILVGPGRWGSNDVRLGVRVSYADINHTQMLIEVARRLGGYVPEVSFGTHFFQDLVESGIGYLPLYPEEPGNVFNERIFGDASNALSELLPDESSLGGVVRVIHVPAVAGGHKLRVVMSGQMDHALGYLTANGM